MDNAFLLNLKMKWGRTCVWYTFELNGASELVALILRNNSDKNVYIVILYTPLLLQKKCFFLTSTCPNKATT